MRTVDILVSHNHHFSVPQVLNHVRLGIDLALHQTEDFLEIGHFLIGIHLVQAFGGCHFVTGIDHLPPQREHSIVIPSDLRQPRHSHCFCRIPLRQNQCAQVTLFGPCLVGIVQFGNARNAASFLALVFFGLGLFFVLVMFNHPFNQPQFVHTVHKLFGQFTFAPKLGSGCGQRLFGLSIKGRIDNHCLDKEHQMVPYIDRFDFDFFLLFNGVAHVFGNLLQNVIHVLPASNGPYAIHKGLLLEPIFTETYTDFPAFIQYL